MVLLRKAIHGLTRTNVYVVADPTLYDYWVFRVTSTIIY